MKTRYALMCMRPKLELYNIGTWASRAAALRYVQGRVDMWGIKLKIRVVKVKSDGKPVLLHPKKEKQP